MRRSQNSRNFWAFYVVGIIVFGFGIVIALVVVSLKKPSFFGHEFLISKRDFDVHYEQIVNETNEFLRISSVFVQNDGKVNERLTLIAPHLRQKNENSEKFTQKIGKNEMFLGFGERNSAKIVDVKIFSLKYYDKNYEKNLDFLAWYENDNDNQNHEDKQKKVLQKTLSKSLLKTPYFKHQRTFSSKKFHFIFAPESRGRYKIIAQITYQNPPENTKKIAFFENDIYVL